MKEYPILYNTPMVEAILDRRKTMTRRIIKPTYKECGVGVYTQDGKVVSVVNTQPDGDPWTDINCPFGQVGDLLWVKETFYAYGHWTEVTDTETGKKEWHFNDLTVDNGFTHCFEDSKPEFVYKKRGYLGWYKRPSVFMPKSIARIWLKITNEKVERLQDITEEDAYKEGLKNDGLFVECFCSKELPHNGADLLCNDGKFMTNRQAFQSLWQAINGPESWDANPWLWAIEFKVLSTTGKPAEL